MTSATTRRVGDDPNSRELVLCMFMDECPIPTPEQVASWRKRYPQFSAAISELASDLLVEHAFPEPAAPEPTEAELARWHREAMDMAAEITGYRQSAITMAEMLQAAGTDVPRLADALGFDRVVLADLEEGSIALPIGRKLVDAMTEALKTSAALVQDAMTNAAWSPRMAYAKAEGPPSTIQIPYRQAILESDMTDERKAFWLDD